jgi:5-carboxymethyl-2-hydroxymuconate isomerase
LNNFYWSPFSKWPQEYRNVVAILKMATGKSFSMSGINSRHHNLPTYEMALKSDNVDLVWYCGGHFENGDQ